MDNLIARKILSVFGFPEVSNVSTFIVEDFCFIKFDSCTLNYGGTLHPQTHYLCLQDKLKDFNIGFNCKSFWLPIHRVVHDGMEVSHLDDENAFVRNVLDSYTDYSLSYRYTDEVFRFEVSDITCTESVLELFSGELIGFRADTKKLVIVR